MFSGIDPIGAFDGFQLPEPVGACVDFESSDPIGACVDFGPSDPVGAPDGFECRRTYFATVWRWIPSSFAIRENDQPRWRKAMTDLTFDILS